MIVSSKGHLYSLDMMKFVAAIFITNSHFQPLYEGINTSFATFGVQGNALFFFVAGYLLMMGFEKHNRLNVIDWYKARIRRLWPSVFLWAIVAAAIWNVALTIPRLVLMDGYWFLQAIAVAYLLFYILTKPKGGERPRTSAYNSEILQSESLAEVSCPISSIIDPFLGRPNSHMSNDAYKLKVEKLKTDVLGRTGG